MAGGAPFSAHASGERQAAAGHVPSASAQPGSRRQRDRREEEEVEVGTWKTLPSAEGARVTTTAAAVVAESIFRRTVYLDTWAST